MEKSMFNGAHTALVTPFKDREFDEAAFRKLIDSQFENGIAGIVPCGTTGESPTLSHDEHARVIEIAIDATAGRGIVIAGTGSNSTREAIALTQSAERAGADAALLVCPYYNKPSQEGLFQHYRAIATTTQLPLMLYSIPGRSVIEITVETQERLHKECPNIMAMKEAGGDPERVSQIREILPESYQVLSGDDALTLPFMERGAVGVVSVASNLIPAQLAALVSAMLEGDNDKASQIHAECTPLFEGLLSLDTNPVPIKEALALTGLITNELRLPLTGLAAENTSKLTRMLQAIGIID
jgi:4-hydroxy-tetrahydrodipicolinate synthase